MKFIRRERDVIEAEQYRGVGAQIVKTPSGEVMAQPTDYIVDRGGGDRYPVKKEIFEKIWMPLDQDVPAEPVNTRPPTLDEVKAAAMNLSSEDRKQLGMNLLGS